MIRCHVCGRPIPSPARGIPRVAGRRVVFACGNACAPRVRRGHAWTWHVRIGLAFLVSPFRETARILAPIPAVRTVPIVLALMAGAVIFSVFLRLYSGAVPVWSPFGEPPVPRFPATMLMPFDEKTVPDAREPARPEPVLQDPVLVRTRARAVLEASLQADPVSVWDMEALEVLAIDGMPSAVSRLRQMLQADAGPGRRKAAAALARAGEREGLDVLRAELNSANPMTAVLAAIELGRLGDSQALPVLKRFMDRSDTQMAACEAALFLKYEPARIRLLQEARQAARMGDRVRAALALAQAGDERVKDILQAAFEDGQFRYMAALGLAALGDARAIPVLRLALEHTALRREAAEALRQFGRTDDYGILVRDMDSPHAPTRISAAVAVYVLTEPARGKGAAHG